MSDITIRLTSEQIDGLLFILESADRGRADVRYLIHRDDGDYTPKDIEVIDRQHELEERVDYVIRKQIGPNHRVNPRLLNKRS